ncbi:MAG: sulfite exporter TauE/SafE family protein [Candidatus Marinimicrobia bacterium]|nr:sulfite exporter TauE/SafE family protein [Candidatus Neomarinimicrobiota bacterium]
MGNFVLYLILGLAAGIVSGLVGVGGGIIIVPALVYLFGMSQHHAQGTTLAIMVPPIGLLAAWTYYKAGYVNLMVAILVCIGFFFGGLLGAKIAVSIPSGLLKKVFGAVIVVIGFYMIFEK